MRAMEILMYLIVYGFEVIVGVGALAALLEVITRGSDSKITQAIHRYAFEVEDEDDKDYYIL